MIELKNISKSYNKKSIVSNLNLTFPRNKLISLIGPNGAGKSTVLSLISRLLKPDNGEIYI
ncbi:ATP-binding cassette domain-containing protein, partial [Campylobacter novaezeelandiae]